MTFSSSSLPASAPRLPPPVSFPSSPETQVKVTIQGLAVTALTQCLHWHSHLDIIAIHHYCCSLDAETEAGVEVEVEVDHDPQTLTDHDGEKKRREKDDEEDKIYFACISCHDALAGHATRSWPRHLHSRARAILCGACRCEMTISEYLTCESTCPRCRAGFNPGCMRHYHLYFQVDEVQKDAPTGRRGEEDGS